MQGVAEAEYLVGLAYRTGNGVQPDPAQALAWLRKAADQNFVAAVMELAVMHRYGQGVVQDLAQALQWFRRAGELGDVDAQFALGTWLSDAESEFRNDAAAASWLRRAADQDHAQAQYALARLYAEGRGVGRDHATAVSWIRKAARQTYEQAQWNLRRWVLGEEGRKEDPLENKLVEDLERVLEQQPSSIRIFLVRETLARPGLLTLSVEIFRDYRCRPADLVCFNAVDYSIRPPNPATMEGGPYLRMERDHPRLKEVGQWIPGGDGEVFDPPLDLKILILDQSYVIAERFELKTLLRR